MPSLMASLRPEKSRSIILYIGTHILESGCAAVTHLMFKRKVQLREGENSTSAIRACCQRFITCAAVADATLARSRTV